MSMSMSMWARLGSSKLRRLVCHGGGQRQALARVNTEALKYTAQGVGALVEVDRILPYTSADDSRLLSLLKRAKESFEMALEVESSNTDAMLFLSRLYMYYHIPGTSPANGAALLEAAADAGNSVAQYELACRLRAEGRILGIGCKGDGMDEKAFKYLELAACKKHPEALFLMGSIYLAGEHVDRDLKAAAWCFRKAAEQGHVAAATVFGAITAKGNLAYGHEPADEQQPSEAVALTMDSSGKWTPENGTEHISEEDVESARYYFEVAAEAGDGLALEWLNKIPSGGDASQSQEEVTENTSSQTGNLDRHK